MRDRPSFYGRSVARAARIEPIVPIYLSQAFAARLALVAPELHCEFVGTRPLAKSAGELAMYALATGIDANNPRRR